MIKEKIKTLPQLVSIRQDFREKHKKVVFTNGIFDILHRGHVEYLEKARSLGDVLMLGLNSDFSARKLKSPGRPLMDQEDRAVVLAALESVDYVCLFDEETPAETIAALVPDVLVKGGDYRIEEIVGREVVWANGGEVVPIPLTPGRSTSDFIRKVVELVKKGILSV
ncbi:MAG: D-glycero-beta-D-manno-heptose 1-phosphate adenylyltransferase [Calditrichia bacterium]